MTNRSTVEQHAEVYDWCGCRQLCRWLGTKAEELGVEIYPGFAASEVLYKNGAVAGIATNDMGVAKSGARKDTFQRGMELRAKATLFAEGCRGSLSEVHYPRIGVTPVYVASEILVADALITH